MAFAKIFAESGYDVVGVAHSSRSESEASDTVTRAGGAYEHVACDLGNPDAVTEQLGPIVDDASVAIFNAHQLLIAPLAETEPEQYRQVWQNTCFGAYALAYTVLPAWEKRGQGTFIVSGATAGIRGGAKFAAFASAKFALRGLTQALAREYGPRGIHVAHVILDGLIDEPQTTRRFGQSGDGVRMSPEAIAQSYLWLVQKERSAWTHELDLRPFNEQF